MKTKFVALLGGVLSLGTVGAASAADMPVKARPAPPPVVVATWTGCYIGVQGGWIGANRDFDRIASGTVIGPGLLVAAETATSTGTNNSGWLAGGTVGCNWQSGSSFVFGIEGDASWVDNGTGFSQDYPAITLFTPRTETLNSETNWLATIRGRAGFLVGGNTLIYGTGGVAFANDNASFLLVTTAGSRFQGSDDKTLVGGVAGAGVEWKAPGNSWSIKAEYLHVWLENHTFASPMTALNGGAPLAGATWTTTVRSSHDIVRVGLNYHFGGPVVAKY